MKLCFIINILFISVTFANKIQVSSIEYISPKTNQKTIKVEMVKPFHGKKRTKDQVVKINSRELEGNAEIKSYLSNFKNKINKILSVKKSKSKTNINAEVKVQVQRSGTFDILNINTSSSKLYSELNELFENQIKFDQLPPKSGQQELQLLLKIIVLKK